MPAINLLPFYINKMLPTKVFGSATWPVFMCQYSLFHKRHYYAVFQCTYIVYSIYQCGFFWGYWLRRFLKTFINYYLYNFYTLPWMWNMNWLHYLRNILGRKTCSIPKQNNHIIMYSRLLANTKTIIFPWILKYGYQKSFKQFSFDLKFTTTIFILNF